MRYSILSPCFNEAKYVAKALNSFLAQKLSDFEIIVVDDASSDGSLEELRKFSDPRVKIVAHEYNQGCNAALNTAFAHSSGECVAIIACDDVLRPNYLETVEREFSAHPDAGAFYCALTPIGEDDAPNPAFSEEDFVIRETDRFAHLRRFFFSGNSLFSPGMALRRSVAEKIFPLPPQLLQHQDTQLHVSVLLHTDIVVSQEHLVGYRILRPGCACAPGFAKEKRDELEKDAVFDAYLQIADVPFFKRVFAGCYERYGEPAPATIPYFLGRMALAGKGEARKRWGYHALMRFYGAPGNAGLLQKLYHFDFKQFLTLPEEFDRTPYRKLQKYRRLFWGALSLLLVTIAIIGALALWR